MDVLSNRDYTVVIDKSGSMAESDVPGYKSRWAAAEESTIAIAKQVEQYDPDGITVYPFASSFKRYDNVTANKVSEVFKENSPMGGTNLHLVLKDIFDKFVARKRQNNIKDGETVLVITDGQPNDEKMVAAEIVKVTKALDSQNQLSVAIFQVGSDPSATKFLRGLDTDLERAGAKFDIVSTKTFEEIESTPLPEILTAALQGL